MPRKSSRSQRPRMHLLTLKGNVWWFRQGVPEAVHKVTRGPRFILINLRTSDTAAAKRVRDALEAVTCH